MEIRSDAKVPNAAVEPRVTGWRPEWGDPELISVFAVYLTVSKEASDESLSDFPHCRPSRPA